MQTTKLNISDMASLMPQDTGEAASLLPKLVELQNKVAQIEGQTIKCSHTHNGEPEHIRSMFLVNECHYLP